MKTNESCNTIHHEDVHILITARAGIALLIERNANHSPILIFTHLNCYQGFALMAYYHNKINATNKRFTISSLRHFTFSNVDSQLLPCIICCQKRFNTCRVVHDDDYLLTSASCIIRHTVLRMSTKLQSILYYLHFAKH